MIPAQDAVGSSSNSLKCPVREQICEAGREDLLPVLPEYHAVETAAK